jgi:hypothetical protein
MQRYNYICCSLTGTIKKGQGMSFMELGSIEQTMDLLNSIAEIVNKESLQWDPFNITLIVRAQIEPKPFWKPSEI